jgi:hypothetical protein
VNGALTLTAAERDNDIDMLLEYKTSLFNESTAQNITKWYVEILNQVLANKYIKLEDIKMSVSLESIDSNVIRYVSEDFGF